VVFEVLLGRRPLVELCEHQSTTSLIAGTDACCRREESAVNAECTVL